MNKNKSGNRNRNRNNVSGWRNLGSAQTYLPQVWGPGLFGELSTRLNAPLFCGGIDKRQIQLVRGWGGFWCVLGLALAEDRIVQAQEIEYTVVW